jgi:energy-coupling factor transport system permease protein
MYSIPLGAGHYPVTQKEVDAVRSGYAIRCRAASSQLRHRFHLWQCYLFTVIANGLRKAQSTAIAMESRGFGAYSDRIYVKNFRWTFSVGILVLVFVLFGVTARMPWLNCWNAGRASGMQRTR